MVDTVLLCPPDYYQIEYEINPWMDVNNLVNSKKAFEEFQNLAEIYRDLGVKVEIIEAQKGLPDMAYAANHGFVIDDIFIKANFRYPQRRQEADHAAHFFEKKGFKIKKLPDEVFFEGQGDLFFRDGKFFFGHGKRSDRQALPYLEEIFREKLIDFEVNDPYYYHLDTCFAPLGRGVVAVNPASFKKEDFQKIKKNFKTVIETDTTDNKLLCCNLVSVDGAVVVGRGISKDLSGQISKLGWEVKEAQMSEFLKGGGSVKCLTLEYFKSN